MPGAKLLHHTAQQLVVIITQLSDAVPLVGAANVAQVVALGEQRATIAGPAQFREQVTPKARGCGNVVLESAWVRFGEGVQGCEACTADAFLEAHDARARQPLDVAEENGQDVVAAVVEQEIGKVDKEKVKGGAVVALDRGLDIDKGLAQDLAAIDVGALQEGVQGEGKVVVRGVLVGVDEAHEGGAGLVPGGLVRKDFVDVVAYVGQDGLHEAVCVVCVGNVGWQDEMVVVRG